MAEICEFFLFLFFFLLLIFRLVHQCSLKHTLQYINHQSSMGFFCLCEGNFEYQICCQDIVDIVNYSQKFGVRRATLLILTT